MTIYTEVHNTIESLASKKFKFPPAPPRPRTTENFNYFETTQIMSRKSFIYMIYNLIDLLF